MELLILVRGNPGLIGDPQRQVINGFSRIQRLLHFIEIHPYASFGMQQMEAIVPFPTHTRRKKMVPVSCAYGTTSSLCTGNNLYTCPLIYAL